jgi:hypothetical protein
VMLRYEYCLSCQHCQLYCTGYDCGSNEDEFCEECACSDRPNPNPVPQVNQ